MLGVVLRQLCLLGSFGYAFREKKIVRKSTPGRCNTGPRGVQNGLREVSGRLFCASWAQLGRQGRWEAVFGRLWGRSWDAFGALGAVLGPSGPLLGRPGPPGEVRNRSKIDLGSLLDVSWDQRSVWRAQVEVHRGQVELLKAVLDTM